MEPFNYQFIALRGRQAGREFYVVMCPLKLIPKIFLFDEEEIPPELRAQRVLNRARVPEIARYLLDNPTEYVFSSITASIDGDVSFIPGDEHGHGRNVGNLVVPMTARFLINDGQHRRAAIEEALKENPQLGDETVSVVFFIDSGLLRSQQLFADLNTHAVRPSKSLGILYDKRDPMSRLALDVVERVPLFRGFTEMEKTSISNRSAKLFTLSAIYQATQDLLFPKRKDSQPIRKADVALACDYWKALGEAIPEWRQIVKREVSCGSLREQYVHAHGVVLHAFGIAGRSLVDAYPDDWKHRLAPLSEVNWLRTNTELWEGRAMEHGKMSKALMNVNLTANTIKQILGLQLSADEAAHEVRVVRAN
jgi:DNA sulfur modification protein DndB